MARIAALKMETKIIPKKPKTSPNAVKIQKSDAEIHKVEFYKKINNPTNLTVEQARILSLKHIESLKWTK